MFKKICKQCSEEFVVEDEDLEFLKKISPTFDGKVFEIPAPSLCPDCRLRRRFVFRNVRNVYRTKSSNSGKTLVSPYAPNSPYKIIAVEEFESDSFDAKEFGLDFDFSRPFFEQFKELQLRVPRPHASIVSSTMENAEFVSGASYTKNAYMSFNVVGNEDIYYCDSLFKCKKCIDCLYCMKCENCYECVSCNGLYEGFFCQDCQNSRNLFFCNNLRSCQDCFGCVNLIDKQYYIFNESVTEKEYKNFLNLFNFKKDEIIKAKQRAKKLFLSLPHKYAKIINCEDCTGNYLKNSKKIKNTFEANDAENIKNGFTLQDGVKDSRDVSNIFNNAEQCFEYVSGGHNSTNMFFCSYCFSNCTNLFYCDTCYNSCNNLFGCVGLNRGELCILNKQYSKEEYETLVPKIIEYMQKTGEWGEFFPIGLSAFAYNESLAGEYFPLSKDEALNLGSRWQDDNFDAKYEGSFYSPKDIKQYDPKSNAKSQSEIDKVLKGIIKCEVSGRPFKLIAQEIAFYIEHGLPVPTKHPKVRYDERFAFRDPLKLFHRQCMCEEQGHGHEGKCMNEFESIYSLDGPEKVYCEKCYQQSII